jgi:serine/threonine protein kinase
LIGQTLSHFRITAKLGEGGMGEVWQAEDSKLGRDVAIKVLPAEFTDDPERLARFEREARVLASLNHPNIAGIHEVGEDGSVHFLAMELAEGEDLEARLARGPMPVEETIPVALQIAGALEEAHEKGIIHRDLKPQNIKLTSDGRAKVLDFGLAKALDPATEASGASQRLSDSPTITLGATVAGVILGTAAYMSPEQAKGLGADKRSDIWAFGVVLTEMLTGERLFAGETMPETLAFVMSREIDLEALPASTPPRLRSLLERCLDRDPKSRLRDIGEARVALQRIEAGDVGSEPTSATPALSRKTPWLLLAAVALVAALGGAWLGRESSPEPTPGPLRKLGLPAEDIAVEWFAKPVLAPDGSAIAYLSNGSVWVHELDQLDPLQLAPVSEASAVMWSPDSRSIGYADSKKLWRIDLEGGRPVPIADLPGTGSTVGMSWGVDGRIAVAAWRGAMYVVAEDGGRPVELFPHDPALEIDFHDPHWLPDGRLAFVTHRNTDNVPAAQVAHDSAAPSSDGAAPSEPAGRPIVSEVLTVFDGTERTAIDWGGPTAFGSMQYDSETRLLVFSRYEPNFDIWARQMDPVTFRPAAAPFLLVPDAGSMSLAGDGSMLYMEGSSFQDTYELIVADRTGRYQATVGRPLPGLSDPALSPDGKQLAVTGIGDSTQDVWIFDLDRGTSSRLSFENSNESSPRWDSASRVVYSEIRGMKSTIVARPADGSGKREVLVEGLGYGLADGIAMISPDGRYLLFAEDIRGPEYLRIAEFDDSGGLSEMKPFFSSTPEPGVHDARISLDGRFVAYMSSDSGRPEIYLARFPDGSGRWQVSRDGGRQPRWAADTGELFFIAGSGPSRRVMASVRIDTTSGVSISSPEELFSLAASARSSNSALSYLGGQEGYDVSADGERFYLVRRSSAEGSSLRRMILVQNWRRLLENE